MCLGELGTVVAVDAAAGTATVGVGGGVRHASTLLRPGVAIGDEVIVHAGFVYEVLQPAEAADAARVRAGEDG